MSVSLCIKCEKMVPVYEKYCQACIDEYGVVQDTEWHKTYHPWDEREKEFKNDLEVALGDREDISVASNDSPEK